MKPPQVDTEMSIRMFHFHAEAADMFMEQAEASECGRRYALMGAAVFTAFRLEAYLQHAGSAVFGAAWNGPRGSETGSWLPPKRKLDLIAAEKGFSVDYSRGPFGKFGTIFDYRDKAAHAKTLKLTARGARKGPPGSRPQMKMGDVLDLPSLAKVKSWMAAADEMIKTIHTKCGLPETDLVFAAFGTYHVHS
jgi:hypothetical protein